MKQLFCFAALVMLAAMSPGQAAQPNACAPYAKAITLDFKTLQPPPLYNNRLSVQGIRNLFREHNGDVVGPHERALGITYALTSFSVEGNTRALPTQGGYCVYVESVAATFGFKRMDVFIASEFRPGTCEYKTVLDHENQHVSVNNGALKEFAPRFRASLEKILSEQQPIFAGDVQAATDAALSSLQRRMGAYMDQFQQMTADRNAPLDSTNNYRETAKLCSKWDGETVPNQLRR